MQPAFSVIFLTTLIGLGQGLFLALFSSQTYSVVDVLPVQEGRYYALGGGIALVFLVGGLIASFFHLGHPERAWRAAAMWRTSWLSREVIALPLVMGLIFAYSAVNALGWDADLYDLDIAGQLPLSIGVLGVLATLYLFMCTGMIYACIKFLQEWATPMTPFNYFLLGTASGFTFASVYAALAAPALISFYAGWAMTLTMAGFASRVYTLIRNAKLKPKSTVQTAIGVRHNAVQQRAMGMMGGSYNTREYFHGKTLVFMKSVKWVFLTMTFAVPLALLWLGIDTCNETESLILLSSAFAAQYIGLLFERWFFFAQANHPQNLYYQVVG